MILIIDHYDSFTYNIEHYIKTITQDNVITVKYDDELINHYVKQADSIIISPGPGKPSDYPETLSIIKSCEVPIFGVCLGFQMIAYVFDINIHKQRPVHGEVFTLNLTNEGVTHPIYKNINYAHAITRYHSLIIDRNELLRHNELIELSYIEDDSDKITMVLAHIHKPIVGVQYHPESILSEYGHQLLLNFIEMTNWKG